MTRGFARQPNIQDALTRRELEVAKMAAQGLTNREIAAFLGLSTRTIENTLARAMGKRGVKVRSALGADLAEDGRSHSGCGCSART